MKIGFLIVSQYTCEDGHHLKGKWIEVKFHLDKS